MFGYVKAYKPQLRICEFETYKAVYCGLCKEMGRRFGMLSRFTLSYDFTFLALLSMSLEGDDPIIDLGRCPFNPLKQANFCQQNKSLGFAADVAILMLWHKLCDNLADGGFWERAGARLLLLPLRRCYREAATRNGDISRAMAAAMAEQAALEAAQCADLDKICHPTATMLGSVMESLSQDATERRVLQRLGYLLGRYVYLADALDDLEKDERSGNYNPLLRGEQPAAQGENVRERARGSLYMTIAEAGNAYELLELQRFAPILENVLYLGLQKTVEEIYPPQGERPHKPNRLGQP